MLTFGVGIVDCREGGREEGAKQAGASEMEMGCVWVGERSVIEVLMVRYSEQDTHKHTQTHTKTTTTTMQQKQQYDSDHCNSVNG